MKTRKKNNEHSNLAQSWDRKVRAKPTLNVNCLGMFFFSPPGWRDLEQVLDFCGGFIREKTLWEEILNREEEWQFWKDIWYFFFFKIWFEYVSKWAQNKVSMPI